MNGKHTRLLSFVFGGVIREVRGAGRQLLSIGRAADHLANGLRDGVAVDAVDFQQLVRFAAAGDVGHGQTVQIDARLVDHCWRHRFAQTTCGKPVYHETEKEERRAPSPQRCNKLVWAVLFHKEGIFLLLSSFEGLPIRRQFALCV